MSDSIRFFKSAGCNAIQIEVFQSKVECYIKSQHTLTGKLSWLYNSVMSRLWVSVFRI